MLLILTHDPTLIFANEGWIHNDRGHDIGLTRNHWSCYQARVVDRLGKSLNRWTGRRVGYRSPRVKNSAKWLRLTHLNKAKQEQEQYNSLLVYKKRSNGKTIATTAWIPLCG